MLERVPGLHDRRRAGRGPPARAAGDRSRYRDGGCVRPPPPSDELVHEMMSFLACGAGRPTPSSPMFLEDLHLDGADAGRSPGATRSPTTCAPTRPWSSSAAASPASSPASAWPRPASRSRSSRRTTAPAARGGRTATRARGSTSAATSTATRSSRPTTGPSTSASSPSCATTSSASSTSTTSSRTAGSTPTVDAADVGRRRPAAGRSRHRRRRRHEALDARFVISAVGALNLPRMPDIPGMDDFAGPSFHSARWTTTSTHRASGSRSSAPAPPASRSRPTIADDGRAAHHLPAHRAVDVPEPAVPPRRCPTATAGRCATCRSTGAGSGS